MRFLNAVFFFALLSIQSRAVVWYVDYEGGDDSLAGTSTGAPFKHCPGDPAATGAALAAFTTLAPGDTIGFKAGTTYTLTNGSIKLKSGTAGNDVTYDLDYWGAGADCIIDGQNVATTAFSDNGTAKSYITIRDFKIQDIGGYADDDPIWDGYTITNVDTATDTFTTSGSHGYTTGDVIGFVSTTGVFPSPMLWRDLVSYHYTVQSAPTANTFTIQSSAAPGVPLDLTTTGTGTLTAFKIVTTPPTGTGIGIYSYGTSHITILNGVMEEIGQWQNTAPMSGTNSVRGIGVGIINGNNITVTNVNFLRTQTAFSIKATGTGGTSEDITISDCVIERFQWGIDLAVTTPNTVLRNITFNNCTLSGSAVYDKGNWLGFGEKPHTDGFFLRGNGKFATWENVVINGCKFYEDFTASSGGGTACIFVSSGPSVRIQNCLFQQSPMASTIAVGYPKAAGAYQSIQVYNNTVVTGWNPLLQITPTGTSAVLLDFLDVRNNLFINRQTIDTRNTVVANPALATTYTWDNNMYWMLTANPAASFMFSDGGALTFAQWRAKYAGVDVSSPALTDPLITSMVGSPSGWNLRPLDGSPAINAGADLSEYFTTDYTGATRTGAWTIGAYQYDAGVPADVTAPILASVAIDQTGGTGVLVFDEPVQGVDLSHYALSNGATLGGLAGSGTTYTFTVSPLVQDGQTVTLSYTSGAGRTRDIADNLLATFSGAAVTNESLEPTPDPPRAPRKGRGTGGGQARPVGR